MHLTSTDTVLHHHSSTYVMSSCPRLHFKHIYTLPKCPLKYLCLSACTHVTISDPSHVFHIGEYYKELSSHINFHSNISNTMLMAHLHDQLHAFMCAPELQVTKYLLE